jgi:hypothetical protein
MSNQTITKKRLCELFDISYDSLQNQFQNGLTHPPQPLGKVGNQLVYDMDLAVQWVKFWKSGQHLKKPQTNVPKLMNLNVKWGKPNAIVQKLDNLEKEFYSQHIKN